MIPVMSQATGLAYSGLLKPLLWSFPADAVHETTVSLGAKSLSFAPLRAATRKIYRFDHPNLQTQLAGIPLKNPYGLAAGFDYGANLTQCLEAMGFGFQTVGSISHQPYGGNTPPMLGRLPLSQSLWVNKGFKNDGAPAVKEKLGALEFPHPVGISVGATNRTYKNEGEQTEEYRLAFQTLRQNPNHAYWELNISCPNLAAGTNFQDAQALSRLLKMVDSLELKRPFFVKMPIDVSRAEMIGLIKTIERSSAAGVIIGNLTKKADPKTFWMIERQKYQKGGFSGRPTRALSTNHIRTAYQTSEGRLEIIGCGGIFTLQDSVEKIRAGASTLQLITALILHGPQVVGQLNRQLSGYLQEHGYDHISQMVGVE